MTMAVQGASYWQRGLSREGVGVSVWHLCMCSPRCHHAKALAFTYWVGNLDMDFRGLGRVDKWV